MAKINLDLTYVPAEAASQFSVVPAGKYLVAVVSSEFKEGRVPGDYSLTLGLGILSGDYAGKVIRDSVNVVNQSEKATEIGLARLRKILELQKRTVFTLINDSDVVNSNAFYAEVVEDSFVNNKGETIPTCKVKRLSEASNVINNPTPKVADPLITSEVGGVLPWE